MSVLKTYGDDTDSFHPSKTWRLSGNRLQGMIDGREAAAQAADLALSTERFFYDIFSYDYGVELADLIGQDREYGKADLQRRIEEALGEDDRITGISDFTIVASYTVKNSAAYVQSIAISRDRKFVFASCSDKTIAVFSVTSSTISYIGSTDGLYSYYSLACW